MTVICRLILPHFQHLATLHFQRQIRTWSEPNCHYTTAFLYKTTLPFAFLAPRSWTMSSFQSGVLRFRHLAFRFLWNFLNFVLHCQNPVPQLFRHCRVTASLWRPLWKTATWPIRFKIRQQTPWGLPACSQVYFLCHPRILVPRKLAFRSSSRAYI